MRFDMAKLSLILRKSTYLFQKTCDKISNNAWNKRFLPLESNLVPSMQSHHSIRSSI